MDIDGLDIISRCVNRCERSFYMSGVNDLCLCQVWTTFVYVRCERPLFMSVVNHLCLYQL